MMKVALLRIDGICLAKRSASPTLPRRHIGDMWQESWAACSGPQRHLSPPSSSRLKAIAIANRAHSFGFPLVQQQTEDGPVRVGRNVPVHAFSAPSCSCPDLGTATFLEAACANTCTMPDWNRGSSFPVGWRRWKRGMQSWARFSKMVTWQTPRK